MPHRRLLAPVGVMCVLLATGCGSDGGGAAEPGVVTTGVDASDASDASVPTVVPVATAAAPTEEAAPTATGTATTVPASGSATSPATAPAASATVPAATTVETTAAPGSTTPATPAEVPELLQFTAPLVGGGSFDGATVAGTPTVFWFWAPT